MQKYRGSFQKWKYFPRKNLGRLITHALPTKTPQNQPFEPLPPTPKPLSPPPKNPPNKPPQPLKFQRLLILTPNRPQPRTSKLPKTPK